MALIALIDRRHAARVVKLTLADSAHLRSTEASVSGRLHVMLIRRIAHIDPAGLFRIRLHGPLVL